MDTKLEIQFLQTQTENLISQSNFSLASLKLKRMLKHQPKKRAQIYDWSGMLSLDQNEPPHKTLQKCKKALIFDEPDYPYASLHFSSFLYCVDKIQEARIEMKKFLQNQPESHDGLRLLAKINLDLGLYEEADKVYSEVLAKYSGDDDDGIYTEWACVHYFLEDFDRSKKLLLKAIEISGKDPEAHRQLGYFLLAEEKYKEAIDCFKKSIEIEPLEPMTWINWSLALILQNEEDEAMVIFNKGFEIYINKKDPRKKMILKMLNDDLEFKKKYIDSGKVQEMKTSFKAHIKGLKKIISLLKQDDL